ncbi:MAG: DHH family phosphoesterase [Oscillospiraceae bacterium]|nr:DHH family phosphoesterase [Oscillospiraceae bacterium]
MRMLTRAEAAAFLKDQDRFAIVTHRRPDGDTLGSAALLCRGLRQLGKTAHIVQNPEITEKYVDLHQGLTKPAAQAGDTLVCVDVASDKMLPDCFSQLSITLRIDHHESATGFTELALVDPKAAACGEIVYNVLEEMGAQLDVPMANALYTAVSTDTGCFRYANTTANSFRVAAQCAAAGAEVFAINQVMFETNSLGRLRLQGWIVENALFFADNTMVIVPISRKLVEELGLTEDDMENISGYPRSIAGVKMAATLREESGCIKLSLRAVPGYDAAAVCAKLGGGGHKGAAGATLYCTMDEAVSLLKETMLRASLV